MHKDLNEAGSFLEPYLPKEPCMIPAWLGCLSWAIKEKDIMEAFRQDTGNRWQPGRTGLERAIDEASGADRAFFEAFAAWMNVNVWGDV